MVSALMLKLNEYPLTGTWVRVQSIPDAWQDRCFNQDTFHRLWCSLWRIIEVRRKSYCWTEVFGWISNFGLNLCRFYTKSWDDCFGISTPVSSRYIRLFYSCSMLYAKLGNKGLRPAAGWGYEPELEKVLFSRGSLSVRSRPGSTSVV